MSQLQPVRSGEGVLHSVPDVHMEGLTLCSSAGHRSGELTALWRATASNCARAARNLLFGCRGGHGQVRGDFLKIYLIPMIHMGQGSISLYRDHRMAYHSD